MTLFFNSATSGTHSGNQRADQNEGAIAGSFTL